MTFPEGTFKHSPTDQGIVHSYQSTDLRRDMEAKKFSSFGTSCLTLLRQMDQNSMHLLCCSPREQKGGEKPVSLDYKSRCRQGCAPFTEAGNSTFLFQLEAAPTPCLVAPFCLLSQEWSKQIFTALHHIFCLPRPHLRTLYDFGAT